MVDSRDTANVCVQQRELHVDEKKKKTPINILEQFRLSRVIKWNVFGQYGRSCVSVLVFNCEQIGDCGFVIPLDKEVYMPICAWLCPTLIYKGSTLRAYRLTSRVQSQVKENRKWTVFHIIFST